MDVRIGIPEEHISAEVLDAGLEMNTRVNQALIKAGEGPTFGELIESGAKWAPEPPGQERFDHVGKIAKRGWGDCDDWAPAHAATLRVTGEDPGARAVSIQVAPHRWHAVTKLSNGELRDPSKTAGMKGGRNSGIPPAVVAAMDASSVVGDDGQPRPYVAVVRDPESGKWIARTDVPIKRKPYVVAVSQRGPTPAAALAGSMLGACLVGGCSRMVSGAHIHKLWGVSQLLRGKSPRAVARVVGVDTTKDALQTLAELCPAILDELRAHRAATEWSRTADQPFPPEGQPFPPYPTQRLVRDPSGLIHLGVALDDAMMSGFSFGGLIHAAGKIIKGAVGTIQSVVSLVPGIGTGISAAIGAGMKAIEGGSPLEIAISAAFGAIPIPPGLRQLAQVALDAVMKMVKTKNTAQAAIAALRNSVPAGLPRQVFDTLAHIVISHIHNRATTAIVVHQPNKPTTIHPLTTAAHFQALHLMAPTPLVQTTPAPPRPAPPRPAPPAARPAPPAAAWRPAPPRPAPPRVRGAWVLS
jgi:hypothetical protein